MANYSLGVAEGVIRLTYDGKGADQAKGDIDSIKEHGKALDKVANTAGAAGAGIAAALGLAVHSASDFEHSMSAIQAVSGATTDQMKQVHDEALKLGKDTIFSASEASNAIEELVKNGLTIPDVMNGAAEATVSLAAAGQIDLPQAAEIASAAMNHFGLSAQELPHVADLLSAAADRSASSVSDLGEAMKYVGPAAYQSGLSLDDTAVSLAELAKFGIKGSMAGTTMRQMLLSLTGTTDKAKATMKDLGIITADGSNQFYDASGNIKSMADISQVLQNALKGLTKEQQTTALNTIFGNRAMAGAAILAGQGKEGFDALAESMKGLNAADQAKTRMNNLSGSIEQMKGSMETLAIELGEILIPIIRKVVDHLTGLLNIFINMSPGMQKFVVIAASITSGLLLSFYAFVKISKAVREFTAAVKLLNLAFLSNPVVLIVAGIVALGVALYEAYKHSETFRNIVNAVGRALKTAFLDTVHALVAAWDAFVHALDNVWHAMKVTFDFIVKWGPIALAAIFPLVGIPLLIAQHWRSILSFFKSLGGDIADVFTDIYHAILGWFEKLPGYIMSALAALPGLLYQASVVAIGSLIVGLIYAAQGITDFFTALPGVIVAAMGDIVTFIWTALTASGQWIYNNVIVPIIAFFTALPGNLLTALGDIVTFVWTVLTNSPSWIDQHVLVPLVNFFINLPGRLLHALGDIVSFIFTVLTGTGNWVDSHVLVPLVNFFINLPGRLLRALGNIISFVWNSLVGSGDWIEEHVLVPLVQWFIDLPQRIVNDLGDLGKVLWNAGIALIKGFWDGMKHIWEDVKNWIGSIGSWVSDHKGPLDYDRKLLIPHGRAIMQGFNKGLQDEFMLKVAATISTITKAVPTAILAPVTPIAPSAPVAPISTGTPARGGDGAATPPTIHLTVKIGDQEINELVDASVDGAFVDLSRLIGASA
jgi:TP901 family phage tail tape measure protein